MTVALQKIIEDEKADMTTNYLHNISIGEQCLQKRHVLNATTLSDTFLAYLQIIARCINLQLPIVILKKLII